MIDATYPVQQNIKVGRRYREVTIELSGRIVVALDTGFAVAGTPVRALDSTTSPTCGC